jgi:argininosuccinate lyase
MDAGIPLSKAPLELAREIDPRFTAEILRAADAAASVARKRNAGGTGPASIDAQIAQLQAAAAGAASISAATPRLDALLAELKEAAL